MWICCRLFGSLTLILIRYLWTVKSGLLSGNVWRNLSSWMPQRESNSQVWLWTSRFIDVEWCVSRSCFVYMFLWIGNGAGSHTPDCPSKCAAIGSLKTAPHGLVKLPNRNRSLVSSNYESLIILRTQRYHNASVEIN